MSSDIKYFPLLYKLLTDIWALSIERHPIFGSLALEVDQYFCLGIGKCFCLRCDMWPNLTAPDAFSFTNFMKGTNPNWLWDGELAWYSLNATHRIFLCGLKQGLGIYNYKPTCLYLIIEILAIRAIFLQPSSYCTALSTVVKQMLLVTSIELLPISNS